MGFLTVAKYSCAGSIFMSIIVHLETRVLR